MTHGKKVAEPCAKLAMKKGQQMVGVESEDVVWAHISELKVFSAGSFCLVVPSSIVCSKELRGLRQTKELMDQA